MPYHDVIPEALEFEVLVARGARRGQLDLAALSDPFAETVAHFGQTMADPRRLDVAAVVAALHALPSTLATVSNIEVVADLTAFNLTAERTSATWPAAQTDADTVFVACPAGSTDLQGLAAALCTIAHEGAKWRRLLQDHATLQRELHNGDAAALQPAALLLGQDVHTLVAALKQSGVSLWRHLARATPPHVRVHAALQPHLHAIAGRRGAQQIVTVLAENGLGHRPLHLWLGPPALLEPASPYCRDLGAPLAVWAEANGYRAPTWGEASAEDWAYAAVAAFLRTDPRLTAERIAAENNSGIQRLHIDTMAFDLVDTGRLDPSLWDSRLPTSLPEQTAAAVILRLASADAATATLLPPLLAALGPRLQSITVVSQGSPAGSSTAVDRPATLRPWRGGLACNLGPDPTAVSTAALQAQGVTVRSVPAYIDVPFVQAGVPKAWLSPALGSTCGQWPIAAALQAHREDMGTVAAPKAAWFVVPGTPDNPQHAVSWARDVTTIARAALVQCIAAPTTAPETPPAGDPDPKLASETVRPPSRRQVRIRA